MTISNLRYKPNGCDLYCEFSSKLYRCLVRFVLKYSHESWKVIPVWVLEDGTIIYEDSILSYKEFSGLFNRQEITVSPPEDGIIDIPDLIWAEYTNAADSADDEGFLLEIMDDINRLQGNPGVVEICRNAHDEYRENSTPEKKQALQVAYDNVPAHLRCWIGSFDEKDSEVRKALLDD